MQTNFTIAQLADPDIAESEKILRACVHCGFCTATCPTYVLDGNELDSPRGRIYLIKEMLEHDRPATVEVATHIDRCLSCLACMTTCPSGVHYMHLVDHARAHIEQTYRRPLGERVMRMLLANVMPYPRRFQVATLTARLAKPFAPLAGALGLKRLSAMLQLSPWRRPYPPRPAQIFPAAGPSTRKGRVALLAGCVNEVQARANVDAWSALGDLDAILITASGCGTTVKDYGFMLRQDPDYAERAARVATLAKDVTEYLAALPLVPDQHGAKLVVAYHSACSMQHGQRVVREPKEILSKVGFVVKDVAEGHLCCGSAGTYNILQPDIARRLRERKVRTIERLRPDVIAAGNLGCIIQIAAGTKLPAVHTVELIDWATGGPCPPALREHRPEAATNPAMHPATATG